MPGEQFVRTHQTFEKDGYQARWRGIYDDKGRVMVAICHNMDLGDSWEHADNPEYPEHIRHSAFESGELPGLLNDALSKYPTDVRVPFQVPVHVFLKGNICAFGSVAAMGCCCCGDSRGRGRSGLRALGESDAS